MVQVEHDLKIAFFYWCSDQLITHQIVSILAPTAGTLCTKMKIIWLVESISVGYAIRVTERGLR